MEVISVRTGWSEVRSCTGANAFSDNGLHLCHHTADSRSCYFRNGHFDRLLYSLLHLPRDIFNCTLGNLDHGLLDERLGCEQLEIWDGNNLEFHPRDFGEHLRNVWIGDDDEKIVVLVSESLEEIDGAVPDAFSARDGVLAVSGQRKSIRLESDVGALLCEVFESPGERPIDISEIKIEVDGLCNSRCRIDLTFGVENASLDLRVGAEATNCLRSGRLCHGLTTKAM